MHAFEAIDLLELVTVTGGEGGANTEETSGNGNLGVTVKGTQVGLQGGFDTKSIKTDPAQCAQDVRRAGGTPADVLRCYGK